MRTKLKYYGLAVLAISVIACVLLTLLGCELIGDSNTTLFAMAFFSFSIPYSVSFHLPFEAVILPMFFVIPLYWSIILSPLLGIIRAKTRRNAICFGSLLSLLLILHASYSVWLINTLRELK